MTRKSRAFFKPAEANNPLEYLFANLFTGLATGIGITVGGLLAKSMLKKAGYAGMLPSEVIEELNK